MKKYLLLIGILFISSVFNLSNAQKTTSDTVLTGKLEFSELIYDFGNIEYEGNGAHDFTFKNTSDNIVTIANVRSSCGCTVPTWPKEPINPGAKGSIKVKYDTKRTGAFSKTITVYANVEGAPIALKIKGVVNPKQINPK